MTIQSVLSDKQNPLRDPLIATIVERARAESLKVYLVGGYLRDMFWKNDDTSPPAAKDFDFAVAGGEALPFAWSLAEHLQGHFVPLDPANDTARIVLDAGEVIDFAGCVGGTIENDVKRRDFSINALAWDPDNPEAIIDLVSGLNDIKERVVRAQSKQVLLDDPLRLLRAFRFKALLKASLDNETKEWIKDACEELAGIAVERINYEMFTLLNCDGAGDVLVEMGETGLLEVIYPELIACRKVTTNAYHHLGLFDHSVEAVRQLEKKLPELPDWARQSYIRDLSHGVSRLAATKLATLLHDIGKPDTWQINDEGRHCFYGHDVLGAEMSEVTAERMKWSKPISRFITKLIHWHLRPGQLFHNGEPTIKAVQRFYRKGGEDMPELILLAYGDLGATCGDGLPVESRADLAQRLTGLLEGYKEFSAEVEIQERLLTGLDVMKLLGIQPGPEVGEILEALTEAQGIKEVTDRPSAERFVIDYHGKKYSG